jgi:hypothetical protein
MRWEACCQRRAPNRRRRLILPPPSLREGDRCWPLGRSGSPGSRGRGSRPAGDAPRGVDRQSGQTTVLGVHRPSSPVLQRDQVDRANRELAPRVLFRAQSDEGGRGGRLRPPQLNGESSGFLSRVSQVRFLPRVPNSGSDRGGRANEPDVGVVGARRPGSLDRLPRNVEAGQPGDQSLVRCLVGCRHPLHHRSWTTPSTRLFHAGCWARACRHQPPVAPLRPVRGAQPLRRARWPYPTDPRR